MSNSSSTQWTNILTSVYKFYSTVATLSSIASALTCFVALWIPCSSSRLVTVFASVYTALSGYILVLASMSPTPPLYNSDVGSLIVVSMDLLSGCWGPLKSPKKPWCHTCYPEVPGSIPAQWPLGFVSSPIFKSKAMFCKINSQLICLPSIGRIWPDKIMLSL